MTRKLLAVHNRPDCIGCGACAAIFPDFWRMGRDGKADIVDSKLKDDGTEEREFKEDQFELNMECAQSCPVNVIHIRDDEKELI